MSLLAEFTLSLLQRRELAAAEITAAAEALASVEVADSEKAAFLLALGDKGETAGEVAAFAREFRKRAVDPGVQAWAPRAIDIVGTGGDHAGGFNISSLVVLVLACAGVPVMKHGNRGITSKCGSADLLAGLGVDLGASLEKQREALGTLGYVFFFAPAYHPAFKHIASVRRALAAQGRRTVFNILGPLINPGRPAHILLGAYSPAWAGVLAEASTDLGTEAGLAVHGVIAPGKGIDELTTATVNRVRGIGRLRAVDEAWEAADFGFPVSPFSDLTGSDLQTNLGVIDTLLDGRGPAGLTDTVVLNAAVALWITGRCQHPRDAVPEARELLLGGAVRRKIADTRSFYSTS
jgi:anthranilate phosphoribosyltransferase